MTWLHSSIRQTSWIVNYVFKDVKKHKMRTIISILSIGLSIGLLVAMNATVDTLGNTYVDLVLNQTPNYDFEINPIDDIGIMTNYSEVIDKVITVDEVANATPRYISQGSMIISIEVNFNTYDLATIPATVIALDIERENQLSIGNFNPQINESIGENKCLLIGDFGKNIQTVLNKNLSINYFYLSINNPMTGLAEEIKLEIAGVVEDEQRLPLGFNRVVIDLDLIEKWFNTTEISTTIIGKFKGSIYSALDPEGSVKQAETIANKIQSKLDLNKYEVKIPKAQAIKWADFTGIRLYLNFIGLLIVFLSTILIYSLNTISVQEKTREYAMLRTIGINDKKLLTILFISQLFSVFWGIIIGLFFGYGLTTFIVEILLSAINNKTIIISTQSITFSIIIGSLAGLLSAIKPSLSLINRNIVVSLELGRQYNQEYSIKKERGVSATLGILGLIIASTGGILFLIFPLLDIIDDPIINQFFYLALLLGFLLGSVLIVVGVAEPLVEKLVVKGLIFVKFSRKIGIMTKTFLVKNTRRNSLTATIFALSTAFILYLLMSSSFNSFMMTENLRHYYGADIVIQSSGVEGQFVNPSVIEFLKDHQNVSAVSSVTTGSIYPLIGCYAKLGDMALFNAITPGGIYGIIEENFTQSLFEQPIIQHEQDKDPWQQLMTNNTIIISRSIASELDKNIGDSLRMKVFSPIKKNNELYGKNLNLTIVGIVERLYGFTDVHTAIRYASSSAVFLGNYTWNTVVKGRGINNTDQLVAGNNIERVFIKGKSTDTEILDSIQTDLFLEFGTSINSVRIDTLLERLDDQLEQQQSQLATILSLSLIIAFFAIFSSTQTTILESIREIGIIKAIGLKQRQVTLIFLAQAIILTLVSTILGGIVGYSLAFVSFIQSAVNTEFPIVLLGVDPIVVQIYIGALILAILGTYLPVRSLKNKEPANILREL